MSAAPLYLVSGASGQLGRRVLTHLLDTHAVAPERIVAATRNPAALADLAARGVEVREASFDDEEQLRSAFAGVTRALLISTDRVDVPGARTRQHLAAVRAAVAAGIQHVVYTSMMNPEPGSPVTALAPDHHATEQALAASALDWTVLRHCWYTDFLLYSLPPAVASGMLFSAAGDPGVVYVTREDCARCCAAALVADFQGRRKLDVTGPSAVNHAELAGIASDITGKQIQLVPQTADGLRAVLSSVGLPPPLVELSVSLDLNTLAGNVATVSDTVRQLTGTPAQSVRDFLAANRQALGG